MIKIPFGISQIYTKSECSVRPSRGSSSEVFNLVHSRSQQNIYFSTLIVVFITLGAIEKRKEMRLCVCVLLYHKYVYSRQLRLNEKKDGATTGTAILILY